ncbi:hypothetical protein Pan216_13410 [Planctomycetes bacterium Pan216]|uniref:DUF427 domain-containing protein n=1 Tax=Kolteria novifilia TaxID=2527975 RepID=A0A518B0K9_9BACT|nr:hypothetical protein Pan216_13410 [Planctomycetes bacterium Pan216]
MPKAKWNGKVLAESDQTVIVEGNHYFPPESLHREFLRPSTLTSVCPWKGTASYHDIVVDGKVNAAAAWSYLKPKEAASEITDHVAFWKGVVVEH